MTTIIYASTRVFAVYHACKLRVRLAWRVFQHAKTLLGPIYDGEWHINEYFTREVMMKSHHSYLFAHKTVYRTIIGRFEHG